MVVNQDHYINRIFHDAGTYRQTVDEFATRYVLAGIRVLVDPNDPADVAKVATVQDGFAVRGDDGSVVVHFGDWSADTPNRLPIDAGWNSLVRLYRPHAEIVDGSWAFPTVTGASYFDAEMVQCDRA